MASYLPRRLTKLYTDTKQDMVAEQAKLENVPQLNALQRKFRIQKDRLVAWGLEWSDNSTAAPEGSIDESIARAGMTETVTSVLRTIQDILDEADHISHSAEHDSGDRKADRSPGKPSGSRFWTPADRTRYVELAEQLATSIDTLHGISRSRRATNRGSYLLEAEEKIVKPASAPSISTQKSFEEIDTYNDSMLTLVSPLTNHIATVGSSAPEKLEPSRLVLPEEELPPYEIIGAPSCTRLVGHLKQLDIPSNRAQTSDISATPVLVEFMGFDPTYRLAGVSPPQERLAQLLEVLSLGVGRFGDGPDAPGFGTLKCLGYFEDPKQPRYGFVFELPSFVSSGMMRSLRAPEIQALRPATLLSILQAGSKSHGAQNTPGVTYTPPLEQRFRIALNLAMSFSKLHASGFNHKNVNSSNILFFYKHGRVHHLNHRKSEYELRSPYLCSFDVFSDYNMESTTAESVHLNIYRHPHDPRTGYSEHKNYAPYFDMYSLGLILLEIGMWLPLADLFKSKYTLADFKIRLEDIWIRKLAGKCGTAYMQAVRECISAADKCLSLTEIKTAYDCILRRLHKCCLLDETDSYDSISRPFYRSIELARAPEQGRPSVNSTPSWTPPLKGSYPHVAWNEHQLDPRREPALSNYHGEVVGGTSDIWFTDPANARYEGYRNMWNPVDASKMDEGRHGMPKETPPSTYEENLASAASTIQRAWRMHRGKVSFREYRRKVTIVQKHWRQRKEQRALAHLGTPRPSLQRLGEDSYPTPESNVATNDTRISAILRMKQHCQKQKRKLLVQPLWQPSPEVATEWDCKLLPHLMRICERALKDSTESSSIDLFGVGSSPSEAKATIIVTCTNTNKVKCALARKFSYNRAVYDLKVHKGKIKRSKLTRPCRRRRPPHRSMMDYTEDETSVPVLNNHFQQRPVCGASIGAYNGEHLPPVSYGGIILVDGEPFGMSVHHMLDAPSEDESDYEDDISDAGSEEVVRSSSYAGNYPWTSEIGSQLSSQDSIPMAFEISDDEDFEDEVDDFQYDSASESSDNESQTTTSEAGDVPGVDVGDGDVITITQPAIDDVDDDFFPCEEDREEDHLDSHELGHVYASSGIRRWNRQGVLHEIDWSLLKLNDERLQPYNLVQGGKRYFKHGTLCPKLVDPVNRMYYSPEDDEYPSRVAKAEDLASLRVHCFGRTSGLKGGVISQTMTAVKVHGRRSYARSWLVTGGLGVGGDSGAWVIDNEQGRVCGHVLAWCNRNHVAYICPMEVLLEDIRRTLNACKVVLPGSEEAEEEKTDTEEEAKESFDLSEIKSLSIDEVQVARNVRTALKSMDGPARIDLYGRRGRQMA